MGDETQSVLVQIQVSLATIGKAVEQTEHRARNIEQRMDTLLPRREQEVIDAGQNERIKKLEELVSWGQKAIIGAWLAGVGVAGLVLKKL